LRAYIKHATNSGSTDFVGRSFKTKMVSSKEMEDGLCVYLKTISNVFYGLTPSQVNSHFLMQNLNYPGS